MNSLFIYGASKASIEVAKELQKTQKHLRKASFEMTLAYHALDLIRPKLELLYQEFSPSEVSFICGTSHGSLYSTKDFLEGLSKQKRARPFLFQNSLHNSITGFLAQSFKLEGPSFTISTGVTTGEDCIELGKDLITSGTSKACVIVSVDGLVKEFKTVLQSYVPGFPLTEGAGSLILSNKILKNLTPLSNLELSEAEDVSSGPETFYYDSNCIELIADALQKHIISFSRRRPNSKRLTLVKLSPL